MTVDASSLKDLAVSTFSGEDVLHHRMSPELGNLGNSACKFCAERAMEGCTHVSLQTSSFVTTAEKKESIDEWFSGQAAALTVAIDAILVRMSNESTWGAEPEPNISYSSVD